MTGTRITRRRGEAVAGVLRGAWRRHPPPLELSAGEMEEITPILLRQGSGGLAWSRIRTSPLARHPAARALRDAHRYQTLQVRVMERWLGEVLGHLERSGIQALVVKGWALGRLYPEPGHRPYGDLDLLVSPADRRAASRILTTPDRDTAPVELHTGFPMLRDRTVGEIFRRSVPLDLNGVPARVLSPEDELRLAALHGLNHGLSRPLWLCDVALLLEGGAGELDWDCVLRGEEWLSEGVACGVGLAGALLGVDLKGWGVPEAWRSPPPPWAMSAALAAFGASRHYMDVLDPGASLLDPVALARAARLRWANPLEVAYRRETSWARGPGLGQKLGDYLARGAGFLRRTPDHLVDALQEREGRRSP